MFLRCSTKWEGPFGVVHRCDLDWADFHEVHRGSPLRTEPERVELVPEPTATPTMSLEYAMRNWEESPMESKVLTDGTRTVYYSRLTGFVWEVTDGPVDGRRHIAKPGD